MDHYVSSNFISPWEDRAIALVNPMNLFCFTKSIPILSSLCLKPISQQIADLFLYFFISTVLRLCWVYHQGVRNWVWVWVIVWIMVYLWIGPYRASVFPFGLYFPDNPFLPEFASATWATTQRASRHFNFSFSPVDLWVVFVEPGVPKNQFLLP